MKWTLILIFLGAGGGIETEKVPGFTTEAQCSEAAKVAVQIRALSSEQPYRGAIRFEPGLAIGAVCSPTPS
jgi:hypothetical protein